MCSTRCSKHIVCHGCLIISNSEAALSRKPQLGHEDTKKNIKFRVLGALPLSQENAINNKAFYIYKMGADAAQCMTTMKGMKTMKGIHEVRLLAAMKPPSTNNQL